MAIIVIEAAVDDYRIGFCLISKYGFLFVERDFRGQLSEASIPCHPKLGFMQLFLDANPSNTCAQAPWSSASMRRSNLEV